MILGLSWRHDRSWIVASMVSRQARRMFPGLRPCPLWGNDPRSRNQPSLRSRYVSQSPAGRSTLTPALLPACPNPPGKAQKTGTLAP
jgi:hypothetical protein